MLAWWWLVRPKVSGYSSLGADTWCALIWTALGQMGTPVRAMAWIGWDVKLLGHDMGARLSSRQACTGQFYGSRLERYVGSESALGISPGHTQWLVSNPRDCIRWYWSRHTDTDHYSELELGVLWLSTWPESTGTLCGLRINTWRWVILRATIPILD